MPKIVGTDSRANTPANIPTSSSKFYHPYFSPAEIQHLSEKQRGKQTATQEEKVRQSACTFIETIGARIGFPRRTIATAEALYHRFHLFFPRKDFQYYDVALAALYVSTKQHDTLKKPRELLAASYTIRYPERAAKSKNPSGEIDVDTMDPAMVESDKQRLLAIERLILETICFNFTARMAFPYVIKIGRKEFDGNKKLIKLAWRISIDCYRTLLPLLYPPQTLAIGSLFLAALLLSFEQPKVPDRDEEGKCSAACLVKKFSRPLFWKDMYRSSPNDVDDFAHTMLDLFLQFAQNPSANTSPSTPSSPSPNLPLQRDKHTLHAFQHQQCPYKADQLIRMKISLRDNEFIHGRKWEPLTSDPSALYNNDKIGQNEGTVRFLFFPPDHKSNMT